MNTMDTNLDKVNSVEPNPTFISKLLGEMKNQFMGEPKDEPKQEKTLIKNEVKEEKVELDLTVQEEKLVNSKLKTEVSTNESESDHEDQKTFKKPSSEESSDASPTKRTVRQRSMEESNTIKRSSRRRSKESSESVLQSAIARKEKSFNVASKPLRSTRLLKPTPKILENLAYAKQEKSKSDDKESSLKSKVKPKKRQSRDGKSPVKKIKVVEHVESENSDIEANGSNDCVRRSQRISSSRSKEDFDSDIVDGIDDQKPSAAEMVLYSSVSEELIASRLCLCTKATKLFVSKNEKDSIFCSAVDSIDEKIIGCNRLADVNSPLLRPSCRVPYTPLCELHKNRMLRHNCCPTCGVFCTQGVFSECESRHQYHKNCQISVGDLVCCPHCGVSKSAYKIYITLHSTDKPTYLKTQKIHYPPAKMSCNSKTSSGSSTKCPTPPLISKYIFKPIDLSSSDDQIYTVEDVLEAVKTQNVNLLSAILASKSVDVNDKISDFNDGTLLHYASQKGYLSIVHILIVSGTDIDLFDKEQNSPLMLAINFHQNDVVQYLIKAGASVSLKGTDGMSSLHLAAKSGNVEACELVLKAAYTLPGFVNCQDDGGWTPLVWACEHNYLELVKFLILKGANPKICDVEYNNALHWASFSGSSSITELLLNEGNDVDAVNIHGDTALHIAARENMYNSVIVLLSRGASVSIINKNNETPLDCVPEGSDCYDVIALNIKLQMLTETDFQRHKTVLTNDISNGKESNPIQCVNAADDEPQPSDFIYTTKNCLTSDAITIDAKISSLHSCLCEDRCMADLCECGRLSHRAPYNEHGRLAEFADAGLVFECNDTCSCNYITCARRVVQKGTTQRFQLFKTASKGWGVRTLCHIPRGAYVCEYVGEMLTDEEADGREDDSYLFDLDCRDNGSFCIDAKYYGNISRFFNHSCYPNLTPLKVFTDHHDVRFPRIALFAVRDILIDEELSFDYGEKFWLVKYKSFTCQCGTSECKYSEEKINETVELYNKKLLESNFILD